MWTVDGISYILILAFWRSALPVFHAHATRTLYYINS